VIYPSDIGRLPDPSEVWEYATDEELQKRIDAEEAAYEAWLESQPKGDANAG
jgi:hypothetical protein